MEKRYKGIDYTYSVNKERGFIKVSSANINSNSILDDEFQYTATREYWFANNTMNAEFAIHSEFIDLIIVEEFRN